MSYDSQISITVPSTLKTIASKIGRGLDPDLGGADSFTNLGDGTINVTTPCTSAFKAQAEYMMDNPEILYETLLSDYAIRWKRFTPPTLEECKLFCESIIRENIEQDIEIN